MTTQSILREKPVTVFEKELARIEAQVSSLKSRCQEHPSDLQSRIRLVYRMFHQATLTGKMAQLEELETVLREVIERFGPKEDLCLLKANLDFRLHRLPEVRHDLEMAPLLSSRFEARILVADLTFQEGQYHATRSALEELISENPTWDTVARLAYWTSKLGDPEEADRFYLQAEDELTAKQMLSYAWLELQRGMLDFNRGRYADAWTHYRTAEASYPGHWHTAEYFAELFAAEGNFKEAEALLLDVIRRTSRPEIQQALGELYLYMDRTEEAEPLFDSALSAYLSSVQRGDVHYFHHLADLYADARQEPREALRWAQKDFEMRPNYGTQSALAWALYRNNSIAESLKYMNLALASGVRDPVIFSTASELLWAAGETEKSLFFADIALKINPQHKNYRMHH